MSQSVPVQAFKGEPKARDAQEQRQHQKDHRLHLQLPQVSYGSRRKGPKGRGKRSSEATTPGKATSLNILKFENHWIPDFIWFYDMATYQSDGAVLGTSKMHA